MPVVNLFASGTYTTFSGLENLQLYDADTTQTNGQIKLGMCMYCWVTGVETNYTNGDHIDVAFAYHPEIRDNYFSNSKTHTSGTDADVNVDDVTTGGLVQNNIFERLHSSIQVNGAVVGYVVAYNYALGNFDEASPNAFAQEMYMHAIGSLFNLWEGNVSAGGLKMDSIHGGQAFTTVFREWSRMAPVACGPALQARNPITCTPLLASPPGASYSGNGAWFETTPVKGFDFSRLSNFTNFIGSVSGSVTSTTNITHSISFIPQVFAACDGSIGITTNCGLSSRVYGAGRTWDVTWGYGNSSDAGDTLNCVGPNVTCGNGQVNGPSPTYFSAPCNPNCDANNISGTTSLPYSSALVHGVYTHVDGATIWAAGVTHTLPPSFYLPAKPVWFGTVPYPPIGPDVTGGLTDGYTLTNKIPAIKCYEGVMGGQDTLNGGLDSTGSPLSGFNASICYYGGSSPTPTVSLVPNPVNFGNQNINTTSSDQIITVTNTSASVNLNIAGIAVSGNFTQDISGTNNCIPPVVLTPAQTCLIRVNFHPTATIPYTGTVSMTDDAAGSPQVVNLLGQGTVPVITWVSPQGGTTYNFGNVLLGQLRKQRSANLAEYRHWRHCRLPLPSREPTLLSSRLSLRLAPTHCQQAIAVRSQCASRQRRQRPTVLS